MRITPQDTLYSIVVVITQYALQICSSVIIGRVAQFSCDGLVVELLTLYPTGAVPFSSWQAYLSVL